MNKIEGRSVLVIGGSRGIGLGIARAALERGARVTVVGRDRERLERVAREHTDIGCIAADATREEDVVRVFAEAGPVDHVVVTVADLRYEPIRTIAIETVRAVVESKLVAAAIVAKHGATHVREGGSMTFVTGVAAARPAPKGSIVAAVNGAIDAFVRALAIELAPLRVNALSPGWVDTPLWDRLASELTGQSKEAVFASAAARLPARRVGTVEDIGHAAVCAMENGFMTGSTFYVDGGHRLV